MPDYKDFQFHLFVCTNSRDGKESCAQKGSVELRDKTKELCRELASKAHLRINSSGCLGRCEKGIAAVLYPEGKWFENLKSSDSDLLVNEIQKRLK